ncbi:alpha/beta hydrolase [Mucilaginibacter auburnensis]|uniref:Acetyl esterase/lipase n=1 Tax=Mucilaginibacter auburnensis TaxID=1457233 RepID=A0A2H9VRJ5_9SPHI|nr:alpha/beta hydrolase [Mucilaginibacter auburnensis]PJJ83440.1 acetyl esterase/lipase [Mucilaginibacter auburnensis]
MPAISTSNTKSISKQWLDINYADDGKAYHKLDIYLPESAKTVYKPVIVIYGSAWRHNNAKKFGFETLGQPLLDAGFAVISINHRSSADAAWPAQLHDVKAAVRFIRANAHFYNIDTSFIGITGYSSGGHLASVAAVTNGLHKYTVGSATIDVEGSIGNYANAGSAVNAVVDWFAPTDFTRFKDCNTTNGATSPEAALINGDPASNLDMLALLSPLTYVTHNAPHFLLIHGDADELVPHCQSLFFAEKLKKHNLLDELIIVPNGQHGPVTFNHLTFKKMADFFIKSAGV